MINFEIHSNILDLDDLNLESSLSALSKRDMEKIGALNVLQVKERAYFQRDMTSILRNFLSFCMDEHNVYLVLLEPYPQMKNRIRSKKGLFYKYKGQLEKTALFETEAEVVPDENLVWRDYPSERKEHRLCLKPTGRPAFCLRPDLAPKEKNV